MFRPVLACLLIGLVLAPSASAASTIEILRDCEDDGQLQGHYTPAELRKARSNIPTDTDEYTNCRDVLAQAATRGVANRGGAPGGGDAASGTDEPGASSDEVVPVGNDADRAVIASAAAKGAPGSLSVGGRSVVPGAAGLTADAPRNDIPAALLIVLVLMAVATIAAATPAARRRVAATAPLAWRRVLARFRR
jgi:hypothetical protein